MGRCDGQVKSLLLDGRCFYSTSVSRRGIAVFRQRHLQALASSQLTKRRYK